MTIETNNQILLTEKEDSSNRKPITIWIDGKYKQKYDKLQKLSGREASKVLREIVSETIEKFEVK